MLVHHAGKTTFGTHTHGYRIISINSPHPTRANAAPTRQPHRM